MRTADVASRVKDETILVPLTFYTTWKRHSVNESLQLPCEGPRPGRQNNLVSVELLVNNTESLGERDSRLIKTTVMLRRRSPCATMEIRQHMDSRGHSVQCLLPYDPRVLGIPKGVEWKIHTIYNLTRCDWHQISAYGMINHMGDKG